MAVDKHVVAVQLSAEDTNLSSTMEKVLGATSSFGDKIKSGLGFGALMAAGQKAFSAISSGFSGVMSELNQSNVTWKTFEGNMSMIGKSASEIASVKSELSDFATKSIYNASDMASTYAQLEAVGTKSTTALVKGFGGLAASAENPKQAMKTLSQQATQMAAKPMVAWQDFKLMLEQAPAAMGQVAKEMGMDLDELIAGIQAGTVKTEDFFDAVTKVGTNDAFTKMATTYKSAGQAMDGLYETIGVKLGPAFEALDQIAISGIEGIIDMLEKVDAQSVADKVTSAAETIQPFWDKLVEGGSAVVTAFSEAGSAIGQAMDKLPEGSGALDVFSTAVDGAVWILTTLLDIIGRNADLLVRLAPIVLGAVFAFKAFKALSTIAPLLTLFGKGLGGIASKVGGGLAKKLFGVSNAQKAVGGASESSYVSMLEAGKAFALMGAGVLLIAAGFYVLAQAAIALADAGPLAIGVMVGLGLAVVGLAVGFVFAAKALSAIPPARLTQIAVAFMALGGAVLLISAGFYVLAQAAISVADAGPMAIGVLVGMVAAIALLAIGAAALGPALTAGAVGFIAFGAAIVLVGLGALLAAMALNLVVGVLPTLVENGAAGAVAILQLGGAMMVFAVGALLAGVASVVLGAGLLVVGVGAMVAAVGVFLLAAAVLLLGTGVMMAAMGVMMLGPGLMLIGTTGMMAGMALMMVGAGAMLLFAGAMMASVGVAALGLSMTVAAVGVIAFGAGMLVAVAGVTALAGALTAILATLSAMASKATTVETSLSAMVTSVSFVNNALGALGDIASAAMSNLISALQSAESQAASAGQGIGDGVKSGVESGLRPVPQIANTAMNAFVTAVTSGGNRATASAKSMAASVRAAIATAGDGAYGHGYAIGAGLAAGMNASLGEVRAAANALVAEADRAIQAKARIASPSKLTKGLGMFLGEGFAIGIESMLDKVRHISERLIQLPRLSQEDLMPSVAGIGGLRLDDNLSYNPVIRIETEVISVLDGRKVGHGSARYVKEKNEFDQRRQDRLGGVL